MLERKTARILTNQTSGEAAFRIKDQQFNPRNLETHRVKTNTAKQAKRAENKWLKRCHLKFVGHKSVNGLKNKHDLEKDTKK